MPYPGNSLLRKLKHVLAVEENIPGLVVNTTSILHL
jgi:hypothetical protein